MTRRSTQAAEQICASGIARKHSDLPEGWLFPGVTDVALLSYGGLGIGGIQGLPASASRIAVMALRPCLRAVSV